VKIIPDLPFTSKELHKQQFEGWGGLAFYCSIRPESSANKALCEWATQRIRLLAKSVSVPVLATQSDTFQRIVQKSKSTIPDLLDLQLDIFSVGDNPRALSVTLRAGPTYSQAIEALNPSAAERRPRGGTLVLWERQFVAAGSAGVEFDGAARQALDTNLMQFVSDFAEAR
jgi:hypothetical protein